MNISLKSLSSTLMVAGLFFSHNVFADNATQNTPDSNAIAWLIVLDQNEIDAANEAEKRKLSDDVLGFAKFMVEQHSDNLDTTNKLAKTLNIEPTQDSKTKDFEKKSKENLDKMKELDDTKFQKEYVKAMVKGHKDALNSLDKYSKKISNPDLKEHFSATRTHIADHLDKAKKLKE